MRAATTTLTCLLMACGASPPPSREPAAPVETEPVAATDDEAVAAPAEPAEPIEATTAEELPCAGLSLRACRAEPERCVWDRECRDPRDECETGGNVLVAGHPIVPCHERDGCGYDPGAMRCVRFVPLSECPDTLDEANAATVLCHHPDQPALECRYGRTRCSCLTPTSCRGAPPDGEYERPTLFTCVPPIDERGCPTGRIRNGSACRLSPDVACESCSSVASCVRGRWRVQTVYRP